MLFELFVPCCWGEVLKHESFRAETFDRTSDTEYETLPGEL